MSLTGRRVNFPTDRGLHVEPVLDLESFRIFRKPLEDNLFTISRIGAVIHKLPVGILCLLTFFGFIRDLRLLNKVEPLSEEASLLMKVPRNLARSFLAFVIRVFSEDRSKNSFSRKDFISSLSLRASCLLPQRPINQSSAYLTYLKIGLNWGLGIVDLRRFLSLIRERNCFLRSLISAVLLFGLTLSREIFFFKRAILMVSL